MENFIEVKLVDNILIFTLSADRLTMSLSSTQGGAVAGLPAI